MKFITPFYGVRAGEIYPVHFAPGDDCPTELQDAAIATNAVAASDPDIEAQGKAPGKVAKAK